MHGIIQCVEIPTVDVINRAIGEFRNPSFGLLDTSEVAKSHTRSERVAASRRESGNSVSSDIDGMNGRQLATVWDATNNMVTAGESMNDGGVTNKIAKYTPHSALLYIYIFAVL